MVVLGSLVIVCRLRTALSRGAGGEAPVGALVDALVRAGAFTGAIGAGREHAGSMTDASHLSVDRVTPGYWRVTFDHPPINAITVQTVTELSQLVDAIEADADLRVVVFASCDPEFFLAHYDTEGDPARTVAMAPGPTGMHPWLDLTVRLSRAPVVSIASIRGRARGAGSELALACDIRLAGDAAVLGQFEVGAGLVPGGGPMARLPRLIGRGRALEVLLGADDVDAARAELYGYVNRVVPDARLEAETDRLARRIASFDKAALTETKAFVDATTLPDDAELPPALQAFFASATRPETQARLANLVAQGYGRDGELERDLGALVDRAATAVAR
jgi:enoyl-CoA hydratase/carnithine racemase